MRRFLACATAALALALCFPAAALAAHGWTVEPTGGLAGDVTGVSCAAAGSCMATGGFAAGGISYQAAYWDGSSWAPQAAPGDLLAVSCASAAFCMAVGEVKPGQPGQAATADVWNGTSWGRVHLPAVSGAVTSSLGGVSCATATSCVAVGGYADSTGAGHVLAELWNGRRWRVQAAVDQPGANTALDAVSCPSVTSCDAVGGYVTSGPATGTVAEQWNGSTWTLEATPAVAAASLTAISCATVKSCTAVGSVGGTGDSTAGSLAEHWDGTAWTQQATAGSPTWMDSELYGVSCSSAARCTAVGVFVYNNAQPSAHPLAETWNGTAWTAQQTAVPANDQLLNAVSCVTASTCQALGYVPPAGVWTTGSSGPILAEGK